MDFCDLRLTLNLDSLEPPQGAVASLLPNLRIGSENAKHFAEPPVRFELTAYALRERYPENLLCCSITKYVASREKH